jgi:acyl carrier protein
LRTGDLGFFRDGELFVTGRLKDVIIIRARNHYPQDIEQSAEEAHPAVLPGAAFALEGDEGDEQLVVVHQIDRQYRGANMDDIVRAIRRAIVEQHELDPHAIVLIRQTSLPITSSGKVQRNLCREQYLAGELKVVHSWTNPAPKAAPAKATANGRVEVKLGVGPPSRGGPEPFAGAARLAAPTVGPPSRGGPESGEERAESRGQERWGNGSTPRHLPDRSAIEIARAAERIEEWLLDWIVRRLGLDAADISRDRPFAEFGVDSLTAVELSQELEDEFKVPLPPIVAWNYPTPAALARYLAEQSLAPADTNGAATKADMAGPSHAGDERLAALLSEVENLSDEEAARLLAEE